MLDSNSSAVGMSFNCEVLESGSKLQAYKKSQNSTWADNEERPFNMKDTKGEKPMGRTFPKES